MAQPKIIDINAQNINQYPPRCFMKADNHGFLFKKEWLQKRFKEGLKIKLLYVEGEKNPNGFIEYVPGEKAWRAITAPNYLFIQCVWISPNKYKEQGNASQLVEEVLKDAKAQGKSGVVVITSEGPFMAGKSLFMKNGFKSMAKAEPSYELLVRVLKSGSEPKFNDWQKELTKYEGVHIVYSKQCPWVNRFMEELPSLLKKEKVSLKIKIKELQTPEQAQQAPSIYSVFTLIKDGKILADHYISATRFKNILRKELH